VEDQEEEEGREGEVGVKTITKISEGWIKTASKILHSPRLLAISPSWPSPPLGHLPLSALS
jgi:hypothetical protein